jgi:hypothetical protein
MMIRHVGLTAATFVLALTVLVPQCRGRADWRIQDPIVCWTPDVEFPVPCDDEDD